ncbi:indolepyruvate ferredoxin oxidoreductase family protein [Lichenicoccus sp.]|uniref:indolepyruvate ferredoxin oxidoreductase family protein n=1 Tax=Lichenicoccus sp. TaxID=2781899 RepID=UPI003D108228
MSHIDLEFNLNDVYTRESGPIWMNGIQALVRLPMMQRRADRLAGLNTAGLVSGYRGSPLGAYDQQLWRVERQLQAHDIVFQPGLNEDMAATALWGAQMHAAFGPTRADGVFGVWYGKGPGVDRTGDVFRNANMLGTSALGGVLAVAGDDHAAQSSMFPHQTDGIFQSVSMPVLQPATVSEILSLGLAGIALSRFSGLWVGMKTIAEVVECAGAFELPDPAPQFLRPAEFAVPAHGLNWDPRVAWPAQRAELERRLIEERLPAATAWARANRLDRVTGGGAGWLGIVTVGKAHQDLMQALADLDVTDADLERLGVAIYKVAMSWPLDTTGVAAFARGRREILVVEEKRGLVEAQLKQAMYNSAGQDRAVVVGKQNEAGAPLLPEIGEFTPFLVARALVARLSNWSQDGHDLADRLDRLGARHAAETHGFPSRTPFFCAGCPHNTSTRTPDGSLSGGGIGCHVMALSLPDRKTSTFSQMGGEGAQWIGAAPFSLTTHIFQNLGDGTYQHSGLLAVRAAVAAKTNITYKILYNDAVAMTGGQAAEGAIDPARITRQLAAEGVARIALVSDRPEIWRATSDLAPGTDIRHRDELDTIQRELRDVPGVTAIVYEQTCAAEKRRRRKRGQSTDPDRRLFINPRVCEGCGDCSLQSNCVAIEPLETGFGRKRRINQSACNKDFSCVKGFCPSFVEIEGAAMRKPDPDRLRSVEASRFASLSSPALPVIAGTWNIQVAGIGGAGVLTIGALLGVAAHLQGKAASVLDFTGLAQKNGAVVSMVRLAHAPRDIHAVRLGPAELDLVLATDLVAASEPAALDRLGPARSAAILNVDETPTADALQDRDLTLPMARMRHALERRCVPGRSFALRASSLAYGLFGDTVGANVLMLGYAWQHGLIPLSEEAILRAVELNGAAIEMNKRAFRWGRLAACDLAEVEAMAGLSASEESSASLAEMVRAYVDDLTLYQDARYAARYLALVDLARRAALVIGDDGERFGEAVARTAYRVMAYKDEYEIARLYGEASFKARLADEFDKTPRMSVWLSPPLLSRTDPATGRPRKRRFGPWVFTLFRVLARCKALRNTMFDPFGHSAERRMERRLVDDYAALINELAPRLSPANLETAITLASAPSEIRGFGPVKTLAFQSAEVRMKELRAEFERIGQPAQRAAA